MEQLNRSLVNQEIKRATRRLIKDQGPKNFEEFLERAQELEERLDEEINETLQAHNIPAHRPRV